MQEKRILIIDDDPYLLQLVEMAFQRVKAQVFTATNGLEGLHQFYTCQPDVVIVDLMLPGIDGWEVCRRIRQISQVPLLILSALRQKNNIIRSLLNYEADDYITKPFSPEVLLARTEALLRRAALPPTHKESILYGDSYLTITGVKNMVMVRGEPVKLSATEYRLLVYLAQNAGRTLTFQQILENIWGEGRDNVEYVHVYIRYLRQKLEEDPRHPIYLITDYGVGYRFEKQIF